MIYTFEINSQEYLTKNADGDLIDNTKGFYTLNIQDRFPELVGKRVIVSPNWWRFDNVVLAQDGAGGSVMSTGYLIHSNLYNMNSMTKSGKSSDTLFPFSTSTKTYYDYQFETIMPSVVRIYLTIFSDGTTYDGKTPQEIEPTERLMVSFNIIEN